MPMMLPTSTVQRHCSPVVIPTSTLANLQILSGVLPKEKFLIQFLALTTRYRAINTKHSTSKSGYKNKAI